MMRWRPLIVILSALAFLWPAVVNGGPFIFFDSVQYIRGPDGAAGKFLGAAAKSDWSRPRPVYGGVVHSGGQDLVLASVPRSGRSIYYGALANLGARTGGFWLTMIVQALCAAASIDLLCRAIGWTRIRTFLGAVAATALLTPMAIYVCFVMPDVFAAILVLATAALAAGADRLSRTDIAVATLLIAYAAAAHTSHIAVLAAIIACAVLLFVLRRRRGKPVRGPVILAATSMTALVLAVIAGGAYDLVVKKAFGYPPLAVPFLTARSISAGHPGAAWLHAHCPTAGFDVCKYAARLPMSTNDFLWSTNPAASVWTPASGADQMAMGRQDSHFFLALVKAEPAATAAAFLKDSLDQFGDFSLEGVNVLDDQQAVLDPLLPDHFRNAWHASAAFLDVWPTSALTIALGALMTLALLALAALGFKALRSGRADETEQRLLSAGAVTVVAILANAAVCGGLSGVFGRYEARILAPLILLGVFALAVLARSQRSISAAPDRL